MSVTKTTAEHAGQVTAKEVRTLVVEVSAFVPGWQARDMDEIVVKLNGRPIRRYTAYQAYRAGITGNLDEGR